MADNIEKKFLGEEGVARLIENIQTEFDTADKKVLQDAKDYADDLAGNYDAAGTAATKVAELENGKVKSNADAIAILNSDANTNGSVAKQIADSEAQLRQEISAAESKADAAQSDADALEVDMGDVDSLATANKTVVGAINEVLAAVGTGGTAAVVTVTSDTTTPGALKSYTIKQGNTTVGVIDIPKDMVVESGEVVVDPEGQPTGTYIKLVLANANSDVIYVNVGTLVDIYKAKGDAAQIQIAIDPSTREISATVVAGSITDVELASNAVTTVKIADGNVTKEKLSSAVQASLDKADAAATQTALDNEIARATAAEASALSEAKLYADGLINTEKGRAEGVEAGLDERLQEVESKLGSGDGNVASQIATAKQEAIDAAASDATNKANAAEQNAKDYTAAELAKTNSEVSDLKTSLADGGATANAINDAKQAGVDAQNSVNNLANGEVADLRTDVDALKSVTYVEMTAEDIDALFA